ncbi:hypothetical protein [Micromonospora sp. NPDC004704]
MGLGNRHPAVVVRRVRNPVPVRIIYAAVRESSPDRPALHGLLDALRAAATANARPGGPGRASGTDQQPR